MTICCNIRLFLTSFNTFWQHFATFDNVLAKFGEICQHLATLLFLTTFGNIWQLLSSCCLSSCHPVILSYCLPYILSFCPFAILSVWQPVNFLACELVLHIRSMISFGGFLAECLPCFLSLKARNHNFHLACCCVTKSVK